MKVKMPEATPMTVAGSILEDDRGDSVSPAHKPRISHVGCGRVDVFSIGLNALASATTFRQQCMLASANKSILTTYLHFAPLLAELLATCNLKCSTGYDLYDRSDLG